VLTRSPIVPSGPLTILRTPDSATWIGALMEVRWTVRPPSPPSSIAVLPTLRSRATAEDGLRRTGPPHCR